MVKTSVVDSTDPLERTPFLRGILTRSLQDAGLSFEEAYAIAAEIREEVSGQEEVTTHELRRRVESRLGAFASAIRRKYQTPDVATGTILVRDHDGAARHFSRQRHRRILESSGLSYEESTLVTTAIFGHLLKRELLEIKARHLGLLTYRYLRLFIGRTAAQRYLALVQFLRRNHPTLIMIGGAPGTGKSVLATEIAQRLEIARIQSTDLLREVMRMMLPERLLPVLHRSSYDAWEVLPHSEFDPSWGAQIGPDDAIVSGYRAQAELLNVPCEAVIKRSLRENTSLILEGVHVRPDVLQKIPESERAISIPIVLAVPSREKLRDRFRGRGERVDARRADRYLEHFESIWRLQSHLLSEADNRQIPIVVNNSKDLVIHDVMSIIVDHLTQNLSLSPDSAFE